ncbi:MAG: hypothetical protein ACM33U_08700 [Solirubrobacterales bacterium]|nr:hypothetical protein [Solirubrobacterales bacterium]
MYARVVRFTDVDNERIDSIATDIKVGEPPPGVPAKGMQLIVDEGQGTAVAVVLFESEEDMRAGAAALEAMDVSETPGTRVSVDSGEVKASIEL